MDVGGRRYSIAMVEVSSHDGRGHFRGEEWLYVVPNKPIASSLYIPVAPSTPTQAQQLVYDLARRHGVHDQLLAAFVAVLTVSEYAGSGAAVSLPYPA